MKMRTFLAIIGTDTPITLIYPSFKPIDYNHVMEMYFTKNVKTLENDDLTIIANEFFSHRHKHNSRL